MKNIIKITILNLIILTSLTVTVFAKNDYSIENVFINSEIDLLGSQHITELVVIKGEIDCYTRKLEFINPVIKEWKAKEVDYKDSSFYSGRGIKVSKVSAFKIDKPINWELLNTKYKEFKEGVGTNSYTNKKNTIKINKSNKEGYIGYIIDYYVNQSVVLHKDIAELYWHYIPKNFENIKNLSIQITTPGITEEKLFKFWGHGTLDGEISGISNKKDKNKKPLFMGVILNAQNIKKGSGFDIRMTFDKNNLMPVTEDILNNSNQVALSDILELENNLNNKTKSTKKKLNIIRVCFFSLIPIYLSIIIIFFIKRKKIKKSTKIY